MAAGKELGSGSRWKWKASLVGLLALGLWIWLANFTTLRDRWWGPFVVITAVVALLFAATALLVVRRRHPR